MDRRQFLKSGSLACAGLAIETGLAAADGSNGQQCYVTEKGRVTRIGNGLIELGFDQKRNGVLVSIVDKITQREFVRHNAAGASLCRLALRRQNDREIEWLEGRVAGKFTTRTTVSPSGATTLVLELASFPNRNCTVWAEVTVTPESPETVWHMYVSGIEGAAVYQLVCPVLVGITKAGEGLPGEVLAVPRRGEGYLFRNPFPVVDHLPLKAGIGPDTPDVGIGEIHGKYPGSFSMQFMLYYNDNAGLYLGCHDGDQNVKEFEVAPIGDWKTPVAFTVSHFATENMGHDVSFKYDTILRTFHGDWYDGADIYKTWATRQWWCEKKLWDKDIADWMRTGFGVFQMSNYHMPVIKLDHSLFEIADVVNGLSKETGVPLLALIFNYEGGGAWTGPAGLFPPREGDEPFREAMRRLRAAGNRGFVYIPAGNWYIEISSYSPPFNSSPQFEKEGRSSAIVTDKGEVEIFRYYPGWQSTHLCPHMEFTRTMNTDMVMGVLERGIGVVQLDNFPPSAEACYSPDHGHPLGYGSWFSEDWNRNMTDLRKQAKQKDPTCALTSEGISENFIAFLEMYDQRGPNMEYFGHYAVGDPMGGETIPLFKYVYGEYIGAYLAAYPESNRPEVLYWTRCLGKCLAQGVVPTGGWYFPEPNQLNPVTIEFYKKVVAASRDGWKYLMFGEMLRPPKLSVPTISASYLKWSEDLDHLDLNNRHVVQDSAVQHSAWRSRDGSIGYFFANVSQEPVMFEFEVAAYSHNDGLYDVHASTEGKSSTWLKSVHLPSRQRLQMKPLSVTLIEVKPAS